MSSTSTVPSTAGILVARPEITIAPPRRLEPTSVNAPSAAKRAADVTIAIVLLILTLPVLILSAMAVRLTSSGPILFRQPRLGLGGNAFTMYKFRTFPVDHVDDLQSRPLSHCPTRLGRFLRRTSLDELPQLFNVLRGDMALVGPRPERPHFATQLVHVVPGYADRHRVQPGITGLAQVRGYWGDSDLGVRILLDNEYIDRWSFGQDLGILVRTVPAVVRKALA